MSKMSKLAAELAELKHCGEILIGISETLTQMLSSDATQDKQEQIKQKFLQKMQAINANIKKEV